MRKVRVYSFVICLFVGSPIWGQFQQLSEADSTQFWWVRDYDRNIYHGMIRLVGTDSLKVIHPTDGERMFALKEVKSIKPSVLGSAGRSPRHVSKFAQRGILFNTAAPLKKGTLNYHNFLLAYNELEYAFTDHFSASLGVVIVPDEIEYDGTFPIGLRLRYARVINERLSVALNHHSVSVFDLDESRGQDVDFMLMQNLAMTYTGPKLVATLSGIRLRENLWGYGDSDVYGAHAAILMFPRENGFFGFSLEHCTLPGIDLGRTFTGYGSGFGLMLRGRRVTGHIGAGALKDAYDDTVFFPLFSLQWQITPPKVGSFNENLITPR